MKSKQKQRKKQTKTGVFGEVVEYWSMTENDQDVCSRTSFVSESKETQKPLGSYQKHRNQLDESEMERFECQKESRLQWVEKQQNYANPSVRNEINYPPSKKKNNNPHCLSSEAAVAPPHCSENW